MSIPPSAIALSDVQAALPSDRHNRSNFIAISTIIADIIIYFLTFYGSLWIDNWLGKIALAIVNAISISRLFIIGHDACHGSLTHSKSLNAWLGRIAFLPSWTPFTTWATSHNQQHHVWTGLKGRDNTYPPFSKAEYDRLPKYRQFLERFYRSFWGLPFFYFHTVWWNHIIFPNRQDYPQINSREFKLDKLLIFTFALFQFCSFYSLVQLVNHHSNSLLLTLSGIFIPFYFWNFAMTFVTYLHHTHPQVGWHEDPQKWSLVSGNLHGTIHVTFPRLIRWIMHDILEHTAHHIDPKIPFYNLAAAQSKLEEAYSDAVVIYPFSFANFFRILRVCKLYDYQNHQWTDFDGNPTSPIIPQIINKVQS